MIEAGGKKMIEAGDKVIKKKGYKWPGVVIMVGRNTAGECRVVVECTVPEVSGALHIYNPEQLEIVEKYNG